MKFIEGRYSYFFLLLLLFFIAELIVNPIGNFPLNDDWCYGKAVYYSLTKSYTIGHFGAMSLFTHLLWGGVFVKIFGFSFTIFRLSTLVSVIISMFFLDKLIFEVTRNKIAAFLACVVLLFNPLYFNLSNTYMTDVNFNTLFILCCYCAFRFFQTQTLLPFFGFFIFSTLLVLLRQFGIILPVCFSIACLVLKEKKWLWFGVSLIGVFLVYTTLHTYENYLKTILPAQAAYKFSGGIHFFDSEFWKLVAWYFGERYKTLLLQVCIYVSPLALFYLWPLVKALKWQVVLVVIVLDVCFVSWFFSGVKFPFHNIFENMWLGPETFHENLNGGLTHTYSARFASILKGTEYLFTSITFITVTLFLVSLIKLKKTEAHFVMKPQVIFLWGFIGAYTFMIFITESYFDRYFIPLITAVLILLTFLTNKFVGNYKLLFFILPLFFYVSVFGTKDYLTWNNARWEAYQYLQENEKANVEKVNAGFEVNCWNDLKETWWSDYSQLENFDYLIQFRKEPGFERMKTYEFQRYFPYKKDTLFIFKREQALNLTPQK